MPPVPRIIQVGNGRVFSQTPGFTNLIDLAPGLAFHAVCMLGGMYCFARTAVGKAQQIQRIA